MAVSLGGCVSVLPKTKPVQLYRFGAPEAAAATPAAVAAPMISQGQIAFTAAASTDRILTIDGSTAAYIGEARWISPAPVLFDEALLRAFQAQGAPGMSARGAAGHPPFVLALDVQAFEARYDQGASAPPEAFIQVHAVLTRADTRNIVADQLITSTARASDNRIGPIVTAYDTAVRDALGKLVTWAGQSAR
jgi:cholesterol transport system auxiliary component